MQPVPPRAIAVPILLLVGLLGLCGGCAPQVQWHGYLLDPVHQDARRAGQPTMVYLREWYLPECTEFENGALKDPGVIEATRGYRCAIVDLYLNKTRADEWGVRRSPAVVLLDPAGKVLAMLQGQITAETLRTTLAVNLQGFQPPSATSAPAATPN